MAGLTHLTKTVASSFQVTSAIFLQPISAGKIRVTCVSDCYYTLSNMKDLFWFVKYNNSATATFFLLFVLLVHFQYFNGTTPHLTTGLRRRLFHFAQSDSSFVCLLCSTNSWHLYILLSNFLTKSTHPPTSGGGRVHNGQVTSRVTSDSKINAISGGAPTYTLTDTHTDTYVDV